MFAIGQEMPQSPPNVASTVRTFINSDLAWSRNGAPGRQANGVYMINPFKTRGRSRGANEPADFDDDEPQDGRSPEASNLAAELEAIILRDAGRREPHVPDTMHEAESTSWSASFESWRSVAPSTRALGMAGAVLMLFAIGTGTYFMAPAETETPALAADGETAQDAPEIVAGALTAAERVEPVLEYGDDSRTVSSAEASRPRDAEPQPEFDLSTLPLSDDDVIAAESGAVTQDGEETTAEVDGTAEEINLSTLPLTDEEAAARDGAADSLAAEARQASSVRDITTSAVPNEAERPVEENPFTNNARPLGHEGATAKSVASAESGDEYSAETAQPSRPTAVTTHVNMRAEPDNSAEVLAVIPAGETVGLLACDHWCEVRFAGEQGFVYRDFVAGVEATATAE